jgi:hypothetical protein
MARYYFDVREGELHTPDELGMELERQEVPDEARRLLLEISSDMTSTPDRLRVEVSVRDAENLPIHWSSLLLERGWL